MDENRSDDLNKERLMNWTTQERKWSYAVKDENVEDFVDDLPIDVDCHLESVALPSTSPVWIRGNSSASAGHVEPMMMILNL